MITLRYVPHDLVPDFWDCGWRFSKKNPTGDMGHIHGQYSTLMEWPHDYEPVEPEKWAE